MADTLRSLAGVAFSTTDVFSLFRQPLTPEELVLDRYVFLPHARVGIAAALTTPFAWELPSQATVTMKVPVIDDRGGVDAEMTVHVHGPGQVTELDHRQVVRAFPKAGAVDAEVDDLAHVEFDRPDLPWLFTPAGPDPAGNLVPWITLVVADKRRLSWGERRGDTRIAKIRRDQLQPLHDAWAWAHAQVMGAKQATAQAEPTLERRLSEANAAHNLSRLVCPRRLDDHTAYVACVVPTFLAGVRRGLGLSPEPTLAPAWGTAANPFAGDPMSMVELPAYYWWEFGTGEDGNFESLARKLRPAVAPPGVGRRRVDATRPWPDRTLHPDDPGAEIVVTGPVVSPQQPEDSPEEDWPTEGEQHWAQAVAEEFVQQLNRPDEQAHAPDPGPPLVGPPLYGSNHAKQPRVETVDAAAATQPAWFRELNTDPRNRITAGLGTRVVQAEQEDLMVAAWNQVMGVDAANRALRLAQLAKHVSASLHRRHLMRLPDAAVLAVTERVHAKVLDGPRRSVWASVGGSSLPRSVTTGAFRRLTRIRGPVVRAGVLTAADRASTVDSLTVRTDRYTTDWVRRYAAPDAVGGLSPAAGRWITDVVASAVAGIGREELLSAWEAELADPAPSDHLRPHEIGAAPLPQHLDLSRELVTSLAQRILQATPDAELVQQDPQAAITAVANWMLLRGLVHSTGSFEFPVPAGDARRLGLDIAGEAGDGRVIVQSDAAMAFGERAVGAAHQHNVEPPMDLFEEQSGLLQEFVARNLRPDGGRVYEALKAISSKVILDDRWAEPARDRIDAPALGLVGKLDPHTTVPARVSARLRAGTGRLPGWVRPGWFEDQRIEPVMAHPRFRYPMYEPLHRYDSQWMVPGLGLIDRPDLATLLETNNRFIEGFLVGLNHEMGRELLWRGYPTDQRGTYFSSFWTGADELVADLHQAPWRTGSIGKHLKVPDGQLVFLVRGDLVRRYPGVVAHAVREATSENGIPVFEADPPVETLFHIFLPPNVLLVGFAMTAERIDTPGEKWWFTLSENPTEPRFGLDPSRDEPLSRDSLVWTDFGITAPGQFLDATLHTNLEFVGVPGPAGQRATWGASSAQVAFLLFQLPARAAFQGKKMVAGAMNA